VVEPVGVTRCTHHGDAFRMEKFMKKMLFIISH